MVERAELLDLGARALDAPAVDRVADHLRQQRVDLVAVADDGVVVERADDRAHGRRAHRLDGAAIVAHLEAGLVRVGDAEEHAHERAHRHVVGGVGREATRAFQIHAALAHVHLLQLVHDRDGDGEARLDEHRIAAQRGAVPLVPLVHECEEAARGCSTEALGT